MGATAWSPHASAYSKATSISYSLPSGTVSGYSSTWKDPWDEDAYYSCLYWVWDDSTYGWWCAAVQIQINGPGDVSCPTVFTRSGSVGTFSVGNGDINNLSELIAVTQVPGLVALINNINWCFGFPNPGFTIRGCGGEFGIIVTRMSDPLSEGVLWAHEYGHYKGLSHNQAIGYVMYDPNLPTNTKVNQTECNAIRN